MDTTNTTNTTTQTTAVATQTEANEPQQLQRGGSYFASPQAFELAQRQAKLLASSALVPKEYQGNIANTVIALEMAQRTQSSPLAVMQSMYIVHGKPSWSATFIINACGRFSPLRYRIDGEGDNLTCRAVAIEIATGEQLTSPPVSIGMAKQEGWFDKSGSKWKTMPELMLRYRAATLFGRLYAADVLMGMHTEDEVRDIEEAEAVVMEQPNQVRTMADKVRAAMASKAKEQVEVEVLQGKDLEEVVANGEALRKKLM